METRVEIINNPYTQRMRILINNEAVSVYSNLEKYMDEPFCYWCDRILDTIYEECNRGKFRLHFSSRKEELKVMEKIAQNYEHCIQYSSSPPVRITSLQERMKELNGLVRGIRNSGHRTFQHHVVFVLPESLKQLEEDLCGLEVKNSFCQIISKVVFYQQYKQSSHQEDLVFLISDGCQTEKYIQQMGITKGFAIELGKNTSFQRKMKDVFIYESKEDTFFDVIFECLLLSPLMEAFLSCIRTLSTEIKEQYREKIEELQSMELKIIPVPEKTTIEVGKSSRIQFKTDLRGYEVKGSQFHYTYSQKGIIRCNGLLVEGIKEGKAILHICKEGENIPCASVEYIVIKRNRIEELKLEETAILLGEGDSVKLRVNYFPVDADNVNLIEWKSDNEAIAKVDNSGIVRAIAKGNCTIRCMAEQVSVCCQCCVKPHLKSISLETEEIEMIYGQEKEIKIQLSPVNCVDDEIVFSSMNMQIVNVIGRTLKAVGSGKTKIVIQNKQETVRTELFVSVYTEKEYEKLQKQREKNSTEVSVKKKKGFLAKLFG